MSVITWERTAELPDIQIWWTDSAGALIDFSSGYTFTFKIGTPGSAAVHTKTTGITGATGSGDEDSGTPNVTIAFSTGELDAVASGPYTWQLTARRTADSKDRVRKGTFNLNPEIS